MSFSVDSVEWLQVKSEEKKPITWYERQAYTVLGITIYHQNDGLQEKGS